MAKGDKFYFDNFVQSTQYSQQAAVYLVECLEQYDHNRLADKLQKMHEFEHSADGVKHEMAEALAKAFVTPVDREDLDMLSQKLDDVADLIEEILQRFYMYDIKTVPANAIAFAKQLVKACDQLVAIVQEFENFKRSKKLRELVIDLNSVEEECDRLFLSAMRELTLNSTDVLETVSWRKIYECFEACADACEHAAECVGSVIIKNT
ncbi:MAG: DUF47 family protein [Clostridia bacterium]|nr:DUF47 family protein [Clostridia bacterium]